MRREPEVPEAKVPVVECVDGPASHNRQWRSADARIGNGLCQRIGHILDYESPRKHASSKYCRSESFAMKRGILMNGSKTTSH